jgi:hypothetical protein
MGRKIVDTTASICMLVLLWCAVQQQADNNGSIISSKNADTCNLSVSCRRGLSQVGVATAVHTSWSSADLLTRGGAFFSGWQLPRVQACMQVAV